MNQPSVPLEELLRDEIRREGPIPFRRFMQVALYHPEHGYYTRSRDPFGKEGDFFTAEQLQPVFGILVAARIREWYREAGAPAGFSVVELGAGRHEMAPALSEWNYVPADLQDGGMPACFHGVVFSNEFFDALPVEIAAFDGSAFHEMRVGVEAERFVWVRSGPPPAPLAAYLARNFPHPEKGRIYEANLEALAWLERIAAALDYGWVFTIDYGYTRAEYARFPLGTLLAYRRHAAMNQVLERPGEQDITAHVPFTALEEHGAALGLETVRLESLARTLLATGQADQFQAALSASTAEEESRRRLQLKTLLFGMGETFRVLVQRKARK